MLRLQFNALLLRSKPNWTQWSWLPSSSCAWTGSVTYVGKESVLFFLPSDTFVQRNGWQKKCSTLEFQPKEVTPVSVPFSYAFLSHRTFKNSFLTNRTLRPDNFSPQQTILSKEVERKRQTAVKEMDCLDSSESLVFRMYYGAHTEGKHSWFWFEVATSKLTSWNKSAILGGEKPMHVRDIKQNISVGFSKKRYWMICACQAIGGGGGVGWETPLTGNWTLKETIKVWAALSVFYIQPSLSDMWGTFSVKKYYNRMLCNINYAPCPWC